VDVHAQLGGSFDEPARAIGSIAGASRLTVVAGSIVLVGDARRALRDAGYAPAG